MASKHYFCNHRWEPDGTCERCGRNRADVAGRRGARPDGGVLPDSATGPRRPPRLNSPRAVTVPTATFDPWVTSPLGPSIVAATGDSMTGEPASRSADAEHAAAEDRMLELVNAARSEAGLSPLVMDEAIRAVARAHSADMRDRRFISHVNPGGLRLEDRASRAGIQFQYYGENIAQNDDEAAAHRALMESDEHRANILNPSFGRIGIGIVAAPGRGMLVTQNFAD